MDNKTRQRLRLQQDFLIMLVCDMKQIPGEFRLAENCPITMKQLRQCIYAEWESLVITQIAEFSKELKVSIPNFKQLAEKTH